MKFFIVQLPPFLIHPVPRLCVVFRNKYLVLWGRVVSPPSNPQAGGPPTAGCPRLLIQYIRSYPPYLEAVSSIRNPRTHHTVVTVDPLNKNGPRWWLYVTGGIMYRVNVFLSPSLDVSVHRGHEAKPRTQMRPTSSCLWHSFCNEHDIAQ
jgi:hypothetical protein